MIELPLCSAGAVRALGELSPRLPVGFSCCGIDAEASLVIGDELPKPADWHNVTARFRTHSITLALDPAVLPGEARTRWAEIAAPHIADPLREILLDLVLAEVAREIEGWCGERPNWDLSETREQPHRLLVTAAGPRATPLAVAEMDDAALSWLAGQCAALPKRQIDLDSAPMRSTLVLDSIALTPSELDTLALRDVVLLDRSTVADDGTVTAVLSAPGYPGFRVTIDGSRATLESAVGAVMDSSGAPPPASGSGPEPGVSAPALDEIALSIDCDIGQLTMPLRSLRELAPGQVLDLGFDASRRVTLRLNGQPIAVGELVRIEDRTGIRITELYFSRTS